MNRVIILYAVAAVQLAVGLFILIDAYPMLQDGEISPFKYVVRGLGPLILGGTFIFLARQYRASQESSDA